MATVTIRNLEDAVVERLKARARDNERSLEAEIRALLTQAADQLRGTEARALADRIAAMAYDVPQTDSVELLRDLREERDR
jgi:plasmid stability protein